MDIALLLAVIGGLIVLGLATRARPGKRPAPRSAPSRATPTRQPRPFEAASASPARSGLVLEGSAYVIDGDTLVIGKTQIRLFGVDAPELDHPYGQKAKWALVSLCKGRPIRADLVAEDAHGRSVARCHLPDGRDLSAEMVKLGLALDWPKYSGGCYRAMETAEARRKLWLADARQHGRMHVWEKFEARRKLQSARP